MKNNKAGAVVSRKTSRSKKNQPQLTREQRRQSMYLKKIANDSLLFYV